MIRFEIFPLSLGAILLVGLLTLVIQVACDEGIEGPQDFDLEAQASDYSSIRDDELYRVPSSILGDEGLIEDEDHLRAPRVKRFIKTLILKGIILKKILILGKLLGQKKNKQTGYGYGPPKQTYGPPPQDSYGAPPQDSYGR